MFKNSKAFTSFSVDDINEAKKFYGKKLGLVITDVPEMEGLINLNFSGGYNLMIYQKPNHVPATFTVLNFPVDDVEKTVDELIKKGIKFEHYDSENLRNG